MKHWFWDSDINFTSPDLKVAGSARTPHGSLRVNGLPVKAVSGFDMKGKHLMGFLSRP